MDEFYHKQETYNIRGAAMKVHSTLGCGFLEKVYQHALEIELRKRGIPFEREKHLPIYYEGELLECDYIADFVCYDKVIVELKAVRDLDDVHRAQVYNYLKATGYKVGLLINFGYESLECERIVKSR